MFPSLRQLFRRPCTLLFTALLFVGLTQWPMAVAAAQSREARSLVVQQVDVRQVASLPGSGPAWAKAENQSGLLPGGTLLGQITVLLHRPADREAALAKLMHDQQDPASSSYHHWLTPEQLGEQFGPSSADVAAVTQWLTKAGLKATGVSPSRTMLHFSGSAQVAGNAFGTELRTYSVEGEQRFAPASDLHIPVALIPAVAGVHGLSTLKLQPHVHVGSPQTLVEKGGQTTLGDGSHVVVPGDFSVIYDLAPVTTGGNHGAGQNIAIIGRARVLQQDITNFNTVTNAGVPQPNVIIPVAEGGVDPGQPASTSADITSDQEEQTLDVTRAGSVANGANVDLIVSCSPSLANPSTCAGPDTEASADGIDLAIEYATSESPVVHQIITISYGACEFGAGSSDFQFYDGAFQAAAAQGQSVFVSSGDSGASGCVNADQPITAGETTIRSPSLLCASTYATCVGGTSFADAGNPTEYWSNQNGAGLESALSYIPEGAWNQGECTTAKGQTSCYTGASGGGVSGFAGTPSYQTGVGVTGTAGRYTPDVAFLSGGDTQYLICIAGASTSQSDASCTVNQTTGEFGFLEIGGTSAAAPDMAGIAALLNVNTGSSSGLLNPMLYSLAANPQNGVFHDVTVATSAVTNCTAAAVSMCNNSVPSRTSTTTGVAQGYFVTPGYDEVTGLGSIDVANLLLHAGDTPLAVPSISLQITPTSSTLGRPAVSLSATVANPAATTGPGGTLTFYVQPSSSLPAATIGQPVTLTPANSTSSSASTTYSPSAAGSLTLTAVYSGDTDNGAGSSAAETLTVAQGTSTTNATDNSGSSSLTPGQTITIQIAVTGSDSSVVPSGTLALSGTGFTFSPSTGTLNSAGKVAITATVSSTATSASYKATYSGDANYTGSSTSSGTFTVANSGSSNVAINNGPATLAGNQTGTFTVLVTGTSSGANPPAPTGTVTLTATGGTVAPASGTLTNGSLAATITPSGPGTVTVTASYGGDANYTASTSKPFIITAGANLGFAIAFSPASVSAGQTASITGTMTVTGGFSLSNAGGASSFTASCSGLPAHTSCGSLAISTNPDGSYAVMLPVTTTANSSTAQNRQTNIHGSGTSIFWVMALPGGFALFGLAGLRRRLRNWSSIAALMVLGVIACGILGCSGGGTQSPPSGGTPAGTYSIAVTIGSSAHAATGYPALTSNANATFTVQ
jgi:hypothetical protein